MAATDKKVDERVLAQAREFLAGVLERMEIDAELSTEERDDKVLLTIECDRVERVIGRRGQVIDALQHLVGKVVAKARTERGKPIIVDADGYRDKHIERLQSLAQRMSDKAVATGDEVHLNPMTAHDRRIVHMYLAEIAGVSTRSEGEGEDRHIIVVPEGDAPADAGAAAE